MNCPYCNSDSVSERTIGSKEDYLVDNYYCIACDKDFTNEMATQLNQPAGTRLDVDESDDEDLFEWPSESQPESDREFLLKEEVQNLLREVDFLNLQMEAEDRKIYNLEADFDDFRRRIQIRSALSVQEFLSNKMPDIPDYIERKTEGRSPQTQEAQDTIDSVTD
jgi:molecular chaperone GrpE (heat shock protein)